MATSTIKYIDKLGKIDLFSAFYSNAQHNDGDSLNSITSSGIHILTNVPDYPLGKASDNGILFVFKPVTSNQDYIMQIYISGYNFPVCRYRYYNNGWVWSDWHSMVG